MNEIIEANLKARPSEKMKLPTNPEMVLLICNYWYVRGRGWLITVMLMDLLRNWLTNVSVARVWRKK